MGTARHPDEVCLRNVERAVVTMMEATLTVLTVLPNDAGRQARVTALSDVLAVIHHQQSVRGSER